MAAQQQSVRDKRDALARRLSRTEAEVAKLRKQQGQLSAALRAYDAESGTGWGFLRSFFFAAPASERHGGGKDDDIVQPLRQKLVKITARIETGERDVARLQKQHRQAVAVLRAQDAQDAKLREAFSVFDSGCGAISLGQFQDLMRHLQPQLSVDSVADAFRAIDADGDGRIVYPEFANAILSSTFNPFSKGALVIDADVDIVDVAAALGRAKL
eukprot:TRINITY_DN42931_c0_g1_i1.p1 TRINITY_DN42931_c0_g1~~TRINITY_DN42931_c0_g1_i1.p1  ORF type:complete len:214 (+),score=80.99 TRINITY_DN42931_c0_g1_i1:70-711(+)